MPMLIDTSAWTRAMRAGGDPIVRARVFDLVNRDEAVWCDVVRLELWAGVRGQAERRQLVKYEAVLRRLPITDAIWQDACDFADRARAAGLAIPASDYLIFACARAYGVGIEHVDHHYTLLDRQFPRP